MVAGRGLSPPTRGNRLTFGSASGLSGSIPAHAGEPHTLLDNSRGDGVYPRPRGGTFQPLVIFGLSYGLSPPTRGNLSPRPPRGSAARSIPAHAGEPTPPTWSICARPVYPRPRGGTAARGVIFGTPRGLSPPTRGNPGRPVRPSAQLGSIPAHAGEPSAAVMLLAANEVYPRPRGGTDSGGWLDQPPGGLSPPTRGNPRPIGRARFHLGSIPAHAGEPPPPPSPPRLRTVYPRPRGGTRLRTRSSPSADGLSPPTRGNRRPRIGSGACRRSIPAHAGEPGDRRERRRMDRVYPRPRGGTPAWIHRYQPLRGLSPPTRGNRADESVQMSDSGSIPAHAGEPAP